MAGLRGRLRSRSAAPSGRRTLTNAEAVSGEAGRAEVALEKAKLNDSSELVLVQNKSLSVDDPAFRGDDRRCHRAPREVARGLQAQLSRRAAAARSPADGHSALIEFELPSDLTNGRGQGRRHARRGYRRRSAAIRGSGSSSSARPAPRRRFRPSSSEDLKKRRDDLAADHPGDPAARLRRAGGGLCAVAARFLGGAGDGRPAGASQPAGADGPQRLLGGGAGRPRRRRRLLALLPAPRARGEAGGRSVGGGRACGRGGNLRAGGARLGRDRDRRDGRDAAQRRPDLHLVCGGHDDRRRGGDVRLADGAAGGPLQARRPGREGEDPVPAPLPRASRRAVRLGLDRRSRHAAAGPLRWWPRPASWSRSRFRRSSMHTVVSGSDDLPRDIPVVQTYDRVTEAFPDKGASRRVVVEADDVTSGAGCRGDRGVPRAGGDAPGRQGPGQGATRAPTARPRRSTCRRSGAAATPRRPRRWSGSASGSCPGRLRGCRGRRGQRHRPGGPVEGLQRVAGPAPAARFRLRPRLRLPADAGHVPLDRRPDQGDRAQPALGGRRLRGAGAGVPEGAGRVTARLPLERRRQLLAAALPVRDPVRPLDGLPRADPQPGPRGRRPGA